MPRVLRPQHQKQKRAQRRLLGPWQTRRLQQVPPRLHLIIICNASENSLYQAVKVFVHTLYQPQSKCSAKTSGNLKRLIQAGKVRSVCGLIALVRGLKNWNVSDACHENNDSQEHAVQRRAVHEHTKHSEIEAECAHQGSLKASDAFFCNKKDFVSLVGHHFTVKPHTLPPRSRRWHSRAEYE